MDPTIGNLLDAPSGILVHGCNAQGVMGSGVAKAIRDRWPQAFDAYKQAQAQHGLALGSVSWARVATDPLVIVANAVTQEFYGREPGRVYVDYDAVERAFSLIGDKARQHRLPVHYPMVGAGLGGGDWGRLSKIIDQTLEGVEHHLWVLPEPAQVPRRRPR